MAMVITMARMKLKKITKNNFASLLKSVLSNLVTAGIISQYLPNRQQERVERESQELLEYAQRKQRENNRRNTRKLS